MRSVATRSHLETSTSLQLQSARPDHDPNQVKNLGRFGHEVHLSHFGRSRVNWREMEGNFSSIVPKWLVLLLYWLAYACTILYYCILTIS